MRQDVIYLISESPAAHGVFEPATETKNMRRCSIKSVSQNEAYLGMSQGLQPEYVFILAHYLDYSGEKIIEYNDVRYSVIRTYIRDDNAIEITVERSGTNAV